ncbi:NAD-dependent epimerase/dehydratase family protein [Bacillus sp. FJAT-42376]|uniref:polysaccharide biosynthesis protein n=1 Tax=Bacillus sp. FJAT-42376 TaxID=2014076 RepID=UPI000F4F4EF2|nr:polysaccharide biosynthesis protein [Bacillus sp. FJAT-42376]AZB43231.1 NAD-dependent epimerase/dehydratase family protein [Bacillus sp. FJAT-42376]
MFNNQTILVTGGTGSWGYELVRQLLEFNPKEIRIFSRNESSQFTMGQEFKGHSNISFVIGDIRDKEAIAHAAKNTDYIFHLAALKHVPICEAQPLEALKTNVHGTQNVIEAAIANEVRSVVYISTDKASDPSNFYGFSKAMGERLIINANTLESKTKFVCIRGGNVLGTNGSVIHVFKKQIAESKKVGITDLKMTRFFLTLQDAIALVFKAVKESIGGEIFVMKMPTCRILDLAEVLIEDSGEKNIRIETTGVRPGEKIHELLLSNYECTYSIVYDDEYFVILPSIHITGMKERYEGFEPVKLENYDSSDGLMTKKEINAMLKRGGFL